MFSSLNDKATLKLCTSLMQTPWTNKESKIQKINANDCTVTCKKWSVYENSNEKQETLGQHRSPEQLP